MLWSDWKSHRKQDTVRMALAYMFSLQQSGKRTHRVKLTSCHLFTITPLWHVDLLLPACSSQAHGTISFLSLTV